MVAVCLLGACIPPTPVAEPGLSQGTPPDLRGTRTMVLPVQVVRGVQGDVDAELAFGLQDRGPEVPWVMPAELQKSLDRAPSMDTRLRGLPVGVFSSGEVKRIGDPLYGDVRRLAALVNADMALIPVLVVAVPADTVGTMVKVEISTAAIHVRTGQVIWFGIVEGDPHEPSDPRALASAVDVLARTLLWYTSR